MKKLLLCMVLSLFAGISFGQVSKSDATAATLNASIATRNFTFTSGEFGGCASLTEVEVDLTLTVTDNSGCNPGVFGVHSDIAVSLESPSGTVVHLVQDFTGILIGSPPIGITYQDATFPNIVNQTAVYDDDATLLADNQTFFGAGTWKPHNPLSAFDGEDPAGTWILRVADGRNQGFPDFTCYVGATVRVSCGVACTDPTIPTLTFTPATVCNGGSATLNITGSLNDATDWHVYTGSCGSTPIGTTAGSSFSVAPTATTTYFIRGEGGCTTPGSCGTVTITPTALDNASFNYSSSAYCVNASDPTPTITGLPGGSFSSTAGLSINAATGTIDVSASTPGTYTVTYTTAGSCPNSSNVSVTVNALDDPSFSYSAASYCTNDSDPTPTITGLAGGGFSSTAGLSINSATGAIDVSASTPGLYTVTYTTTGPCPNSSNVSVTIQAAVSVTFTALADLCIDEGVQTGLGGGLPTGGVYSGPGVTDDGNGTTYSFDPALAGAGVHIITYTVSGACTTPASDNVEVFPAVGGSTAVNVYNINTATNPLVGGVCGGNTGIDNTYNCAFNGQPEEIVGSFTDLSAIGSTLDNVAISFFSACGGDITLYLNGVPIATQTLTGLSCSCQSIASDPGIPQSIPVTMTPAIQAAFIPGGVNNITATSANSAGGTICYYGVDLTISTSSGVSFTAPADVCIDAGVQTGLGGGTPTGGVYSGTGVTDDGNGTTYSFDPAVAGLGVHTLTYTFTNANGCVGSATDNIEVLPVITGSFTALADLCVDAGVQAGQGGGLPVGGVYSGAGVTDDGNGTTYSFDPAAAGVGVHTITYTPSGGCSNAANDNIEVFALPSVTFTAPADLCINAGVQTGLGGGTPTGGVYSGPGVTDDGNGTTYSFDPAAAGVGTHTITYTLTDVNGCSGSANDQVEVFALPTVTFTALADLCLDAGIQAGLGGGTPMGGVYSGPGVTDDGNGMSYSFDPAAAGVGVHTITYTFTNANGCTGSASDFVEVFALPAVTFTGPGTFCSTDGVQTGLSGGSPSGGVYSGPGVTDDGNGMTYSFDPAAAGIGSHIITYTFTNVNGCTGSANDIATVSLGGAVTAVCQDVTIFLDANGEASIVASDIDGGSSVGCGTLNLTASQTDFTCADVPLGATPTNNLVITGAYDGPLTGGTPKGVELYVINDIADLSQYGLGSANNGGGSDGEEFTFPAVAATAGQFIYVSSESTQFANWFGFAPDYTTGAMGINGDDAVELFYQGGVIDIFGDINTDGSGEVWDYLDGWAYRVNDTGNDGSAWTPSNWTYSGINALDGETSNGTAVTPFPVGTYSITVATPNSVTLTVTDGLGGSATCTANVTVLDTISPVANCQDATVYLDGTGSASITAVELEGTGVPGLVYFTNTNGAVNVANVDGSGTPTQLYNAGSNAVGIDHDPVAGDLYWARGNTWEITTASDDGLGTPLDLPNSSGQTFEHLDVDLDPANGRHFFTTGNGNGIYSALMDGSGTATLLFNSGGAVNGVDYNPNNDKVYFTALNANEIYEMDANGSNPAVLFGNADGVDNPRGLITDATKIYWVNRGSGQIMSGNLNGTGTPVVLYTANLPYHIDLEETTGMLVWTEHGGTGDIMTAPADGSGSPAAIQTGLGTNLRGIALGSAPLGAGHSDNCGTVTSTIDVSTFDCSNVGSPVSVTSTVTDNSGNTSTCTSQVTVLDTISPTITCPVDIVQDQDTGVCSADITVPSITTADNCSGETIAWAVSGSTTATGTGQPGVQTFNVGVSTVDVIATDASGNTANCSFLVTVNDTVAPTLPVLADSIGECSVTVAAPTTSDNCNGTITGTTTDPTTVTSQGTTVITWTFDDGAGNVSTATQNVIINDAIAPTASNIDTAFVECIGDVAIDITLVDDEADNCTAAPVVAYVGDVASNGTGCNDTVVRTYSVTDDVGNSINVEQIIILNDVTAPTASNPITLNVVCLAEVPDTTGAASWVTDEADNCGNSTVTWLNDVSSNGTGCNDTITRTFEVADACGNSIQVQQTIIINDDDAPVADVAVLADVNGTCDVTPVAPTATDNCAGSLNGLPDVTFPISAVGTTVVTWTYTDNCGNSISQTQNVIVSGVDVGTTMASDNITMIATNTNAGVTYQWYDCVSGTIVAGETNVNFTPSYGSDFAVIVTENGCADTSACVNSTVGLDPLTLNQFTMFPNPTENGFFSIQLDAELKEVSVLDMTGRLVEVEVDLTEKRVNVSNLVNGAYIVRIVTETEQELVGTIRVQ